MELVDGGIIFLLVLFRALSLLPSLKNNLILYKILFRIDLFRT